MVILTQEMIRRGMSVNGGWNNKQTEILGEKQTNGWLKRLVGKVVTQEQFDVFVSLKDSHLKPYTIQKKICKEVKGLDFVPSPENIPWADQYLHPNWQKMRTYCLKRDNFQCVNCKDRESTLHQHHLRYLPNKKIWEVPHYYVITLCETCHSIEHNRDLTAKKNWKELMGSKNQTRLSPKEANMSWTPEALQRKNQGN